MSNADITAIILAAGRGSRLLSLTDDRPKGLVKLDGRSLIDWQIDAIRQAGIKNIKIVNGYLEHKFDKLGFDTITNKNWDKTNMVGSLMCALDKLDGPFLVSYSDIVYHPSIVSGLIESKDDFILSYDTDWLSLWSDRFEDPLSDAETFRIKNDKTIVEIGHKPKSLEEIEGQFMGLYTISQKAVNWIRDLLSEEPSLRNTLDTTTMINLLISYFLHS